ncbi:MAG: hypothetical protein JNN18_08415 [Rubrivivax sp.]|jgi:hypothetical protein|nr:hypothetical protein [Rubrivivax sp.]
MSSNSSSSGGRGNGRDDGAGHDAGDDHGVDDPATHDVGDDHGVDDPATHDIGDDKGADDPATHDVGDDKGMDDPATHDVGDDHGGARQLGLFVNQATQQLVFSADSTELEHWRGDDRLTALDLSVSVPGSASADSSPVWRFHDPVSDVYFWTADDSVRDSLVRSHPELEYSGEAFHAWRDDGGGTHQAIGVVWDHDHGGDYGRFVYAPVDDAVRIAGQSSSDGMEYLGIAFWI